MKYARDVNVKTPSIMQLVENLSRREPAEGGCRQAAVSRDPEVLIFDEPTVGVDVGAKQEIYRIVEKLISEGRSVILISSYLPEVMSLSDRLIVMAHGRITAEYGPEELKSLTEEDVLRSASIRRR